VKIDILVGPVGQFRKKLHIKMPRVRPKGNVAFHAHAVEEAIQIEDELTEVVIAGERSTGDSYQGTVFIPQAFPYLMMKLHAFEDRKEDRRREQGRHHALDLYTIVGMMTEEEYERARELAAVHGAEEHFRRACAIVRSNFAEETRIGILRLREHTLFRRDFPLKDFIRVLGEIFPSG
jgi:hypothetical protein